MAGAQADVAIERVIRADPSTSIGALLWIGKWRAKSRAAGSLA